MKRPVNQETDDINDFYSQLLGDSSNNFFRLPKSLQQTKIAKRIDERKRTRDAHEHRLQASRTAYQQFLLDSQHKQESHRSSPPTVNSTRTTAATTLSSSCIRKPLLRVAAFLVLLTGIISASLLAYRYWRAPTPIQQENTDLTPQSVIVPMKLPEGYSVGSSLQSLENGAKLYTIYTDKGQEITVTHQAKDDSFIQPVVKGAASFTTPVGTAFVLKDGERTTGYLFTDAVWVLFNSTSPMEPEDMRRLIEVFVP